MIEKKGKTDFKTFKELYFKHKIRRKIICTCFKWLFYRNFENKAKYHKTFWFDFFANE